MPVTLFCRQCCMYRSCQPSGKLFVCPICGSAVELPQDPDACPRSPTGAHNPYRAGGSLVCSQCNVLLASDIDH